MIYSVTVWFRIKQCGNKRAISIGNLVERTGLDIYLVPTEIKYYQGSTFIGHEFRKYLIEGKYGIGAKPSTLWNPTSNAILYWVHTVLSNLVRKYNNAYTYIYYNDPWLVVS